MVKDAKADIQRRKRLHLAACLSGGLLSLVLLGLCFGAVRMVYAEPVLGGTDPVVNTGPELSSNSSAAAAVNTDSGGLDWKNKRLAKVMAASRPAPQTLPSRINNGLRTLTYAFVAAALCLPAALIIRLRRLALPPVIELEASAPAPAPVEMDPAIKILLHELGAGPSATTPSQVSIEDYGPVPLQLEKIAGLFGQINKAAEPAARQKMLSELARAFYGLKQSCHGPGLRVMWQCASLLQALARQVAQRESEVTRSCLRTLGGGIDLLRRLTEAGKLKDNLTADPPVKVLAVDDNPICLRAVAMALKNAFPGIDTAADGASALLLAEASSYDAIFLDVEMPGMDGFELCSKIHQTDRNEKTPVIFVTAHSDFDSRARSAVCGCHELIGKPFLALEISLKAFALIVGRRLPNTPEEAAVTAGSNSRTGILPLVDTTSTAAGETNRVTRVWTGNSAARQTELRTVAESEGAAQMFLNQAPDRLRSARFHWQVLAQAPDAEARRQILELLRIDAQLLATGAQGARWNAPYQIAFALQGLLSKLHERPDYFTESCSSALATALEVLEELCGDHASLRKPWTPPRILVVDDDPVALRAISGALQYNFGKPEAADCGEASLALAERQRFDVVFMDVRMPGIDGFATCSRLRQTALNSETPVVFVTSHDDAESRKQAVLVQSSGLIVKPVLPSEIRLTAITLALKGSRAEAVGPCEVTL